MECNASCSKIQRDSLAIGAKALDFFALRDLADGRRTECYIGIVQGQYTHVGHSKSDQNGACSGFEPRRYLKLIWGDLYIDYQYLIARS